MTTAAAPATVVLVHGAWHGPWCFNKVVAGLEERGVPVVNVERRRLHEPSGELRGVTNSDENEQIVRAALAEVAGPVVLLGHSFGGVAITTAPLGNKNVKHLVYLTAIMPDTDGGIPDNFANPELIGAMQVAERWLDHRPGRHDPPDPSTASAPTRMSQTRCPSSFGTKPRSPSTARATPRGVRSPRPTSCASKTMPCSPKASASSRRRADRIRRVAHRPLPLLQQPKPRHRPTGQPGPRIR